MPVQLRRILMSIFSNRRNLSAFSVLLLLGLLLWARLIVTSNMPRTAVADEKNLDTESQKMLPDPGIKGADNPRSKHMQRDLPESPIADPFLVIDKYFPKPTLVDELKQDRAKLRDQETEITHERKPK